MADDTNTSFTGVPPVPPPVLSGQELYDTIMRDIEPDLLSSNVETLAVAYETQSPEEKAERADRYRQAFAEYERRLAQYQLQWDMQLSAYKRQAISYIEHQSQSNEAAELQNIESSINE